MTTIKYVDVMVGFREVPNEISLCINISGCPNHCEDCHSKYLWDNIGKSLSLVELHKLISSNDGITCVSLMGGDNNPLEINNLARWIKNNYNLKVCWYSGKSTISKFIDKKNFDYIKIGEYDKDKGPLDKETTNQIFYKVNHENFDSLEEITYLFWKNDTLSV